MGFSIDHEGNNSFAEVQSLLFISQYNCNVNCPVFEL